MPAHLRWPQILAFRLSRQHLWERTAADLADVCGDVCGIQAQVMSAAEIALWARGDGVNRGAIGAALEENRTLVRTSCMRQTLHLLPSADFRLYITALKPSRIVNVWRILSKFSVTPAEVAGLNTAVMDALADGPLTQREVTRRIRPIVSKRVQTWMRYVWSALRPAVAEGLICYGPTRGRDVTFVRTDQWLPRQRQVPERDAQRTLLRRYLRAYGPATVADFAKWAGMSMPEAKGIWAAAEGDLAEVAIPDGKVFLLREDRAYLANAEPLNGAVRLLPAFDVYLLSHVDKSPLVDARFYKRVYRNQGWISPVVLLDGRVIATWSIERAGKRSTLEVQPFQAFSKGIRAGIEREAGSLSRFLEAAWTVTFSAGRPRPHRRSTT